MAARAGGPLRPRRDSGERREERSSKPLEDSDGSHRVEVRDEEVQETVAVQIARDDLRRSRPRRIGPDRREVAGPRAPEDGRRSAVVVRRRKIAPTVAIEISLREADRRETGLASEPSGESLGETAAREKSESESCHLRYLRAITKSPRRFSSGTSTSSTWRAPGRPPRTPSPSARPERADGLAPRDLVLQLPHAIG